ncbi:hypothetical protein CVD28_12270 [Bacillus sp. M6-12]|nr:hypothetical protein CVD28_12270 [Bacillus sp. M6-12]
MGEMPEDASVSTIELKMNYVRPGSGEKLFAKPAILHMGKNTVVAESRIFNDNEQLVAVGLGTFFLKRQKVNKSF